MGRAKQMNYPEDKKVEIDWNDCDLYYSAVTEEYTRWRRESLEPTGWPEYEELKLPMPFNTHQQSWII